MASFSTTVTKSTTASSLPGLVADSIDGSGTSGDQSQDAAFLLRGSSYASGADTLYELHVYDMNHHNILYLDQDSTTAFTDVSISNFTFKKHVYYYATYLKGGDFDYQVLDSSGNVVVGETTIGKSTDISSVMFDAKGDLVAHYATAKYATISFQQNDPPVAVNDTASSAWDSDVKANVLANDTDANSDKLSIASASVTDGDATVSIANGKLVVHYTGSGLDLGETAEVHVKYTVSDGSDTDSGKLTVTFNDGYNRIDGTNRDDNLSGTGGRDVIYAKDSSSGSNQDYDHSDNVDGKAGADIIFGGNGRNLLYGGDGNDTLHGGNDGSYDRLFGESGDDTLYGYNGPSNLQGNEGNDWILGGDNQDEVYGGDGKDTIAGGAGDDLISGGDWRDDGDGPSNDAWDDADIIFGGRGNDRIYGQGGADTLSGNSGNDTIRGGLGNDTIMGGLGNDTMVGGAGDDEFYFFKSSGKDTILDFSRKGANGADVLYLDRDMIKATDHHNPTVTYGSDYALVDLGGGDTIRLEGVHKGELTGDWYKVGDYSHLNLDAFFG